MKHISSAIRDLLRSGEFAADLTGWRAVTLWPDVVGDTLAGRARAIRFADGRLFVEVESPIWAQELSFLKPRIVRQLTEALGREAVSSISFVRAGGGRGSRGRVG